MRITVEFTDIDEFLAELKARPPVPPDEFVRVTTEWRRVADSPWVQVTLVATYLLRRPDGAQIVELRRYVGEDGDAPPFQRPEVRERWERLHSRLVEGIRQLGFEVVPGRYRAG